MRVTKEEIEYKAAPYGFIAIIPKGTPVSPAYNLPDDMKYWAHEWHDIENDAKNWCHSYGFLIEEYQTIIQDQNT